MLCGRDFIFSKLRNVLEFFEQTSNSGLKINLLQKYFFVSLDLFKESLHNRSIETEMDAWLSFLTIDDPAMIIQLIEKFPRFKELYEIIYHMCLNIEGVMKMFSEELRILDRNTVRLMIDEMQEEITTLQRENNSLQMEYNSLQDENNSLQDENNSLQDENNSLQDEIKHLKEQLNSSKGIFM